MTETTPAVGPDLDKALATALGGRYVDKPNMCPFIVLRNGILGDIPFAYPSTDPVEAIKLAMWLWRQRNWEIRLELMAGGLRPKQMRAAASEVQHASRDDFQCGNEWSSAEAICRAILAAATEGA